MPKWLSRNCWMFCAAMSTNYQQRPHSRCKSCVESHGQGSGVGGCNPDALFFFFFSHSRLNYLVMHYFSTQISFEQSCCPIFLWFPFKAVDSLIQMSPKVLVEEKDSMKPFAKGKYSGRKEPVRQSDLVFKKKLGLVI